MTDKVFKALDEIIHNWDLLTTVIENNAMFLFRLTKNTHKTKLTITN